MIRSFLCLDIDFWVWPKGDDSLLVLAYLQLNLYEPELIW